MMTDDTNNTAARVVISPAAHRCLVALAAEDHRTLKGEIEWLIDRAKAQRRTARERVAATAADAGEPTS